MVVVTINILESHRQSREERQQGERSVGTQLNISLDSNSGHLSHRLVSLQLGALADYVGGKQQLRMKTNFPSMNPV